MIAQCPTGHSALPGIVRGNELPVSAALSKPLAPLYSGRETPPPATHTLHLNAIHHLAMGKLKTVLLHIHT